MQKFPQNLYSGSMSNKRFIGLLIGVLLLSVGIGYLLKREEKKVKEPTQGRAFDYTVDPISALVFRKKIDEDGAPVLEITFVGPKSAPFYHKHIYALVNCSLSLSSLAYSRPYLADDDPRREEVVQTGIDVYENAERDDILTALCQDESCYQIGGACSLRRDVYDEKP